MITKLAASKGTSPTKKQAKRYDTKRNNEDGHQSEISSLQEAF